MGVFDIFFMNRMWINLVITFEFEVDECSTFKPDAEWLMKKIGCGGRVGFFSGDSDYLREDGEVYETGDSRLAINLSISPRNFLKIKERLEQHKSELHQRIGEMATGAFSIGTTARYDSHNIEKLRKIDKQLADEILGLGQRGF